MSRVFFSGWMMRLWTLNEDNLSPKLWVQFQDDIIDSDETFSGLSIMMEPEIISLHRLQNDSITQEIQEMGKYDAQNPRYLVAFQRLLRKVWSLVDQLKAGLNATGYHLPNSGLGLLHERRNSIFALLSRFYRNWYLVRKRDYPVTQKYCADKGVRTLQG